MFEFVTQFIISFFMMFNMNATKAVQSFVQFNIEKEQPIITEVIKEEPKVTEVVKEQPKIVEKKEIKKLSNHLYVNNIDVEVIQINPSSTYELQNIVDHPSKAACYKYGSCLYIGDHSNQNFSTLPQVKVGDKMYWQNKVYSCYYIDDFGYLDTVGHIHLSNTEYLHVQSCIALVTCKNNGGRYIRLFKEEN